MAVRHFPASSPYVKAPFGASDPAWLVRAYPFATLVSPQLHVTATPVYFEHDESEATLVGHMHRANPHTEALTYGDTVLATCMGPHAYISPRWYVERPTVPTWNYLMAIIRGTIEPIDDDAGQLAVLRRSVEKMEAAALEPWTLEDAPEGRIELLLPRIRSFRIHVETIEGMTKLSQIQPPGDRTRVIDALRALPAQPDIAAVMQSHYAQD